MNDDILKAICFVADKSVYVNAHFRINSGPYVMSEMPAERYATFATEIKDILTSIGFGQWNKDEGGICPRGKRNVEELYCHPHDLSGNIKRESIAEITEAIAVAKTFKLQNVDTYAEYLHFTEDELRQVLTARRDEISDKLLFLYQCGDGIFTPGNFWVVLHQINLRIPYLDRDNKLRAVEQTFIGEVFEKLVQDGAIEKRIVDGKLQYRNARVISRSAALRKVAKRVEAILHPNPKIGDIEILHERKGKYIIFSAWRGHDLATGRQIHLERQDILCNGRTLTQDDIEWLAGSTHDRTAS